jgi:hypothetical protein
MTENIANECNGGKKEQVSVIAENIASECNGRKYSK